MSDAQSTITGLKAQDCPGGGWNGMPTDLERATVADCLAHGACGCIYGDAVQHIERLRRELNLLKAVHESAEAEVRQLLDENGSLIAVCREFIDRWPTEQGIDNTIQRARAILLDHDLRSPPEHAVNRALEGKR